jgi:hypothetical protein
MLPNVLEWLHDGWTAENPRLFIVGFILFWALLSLGIIALEEKARQWWVRTRFTRRTAGSRMRRSSPLAPISYHPGQEREHQSSGRWFGKLNRRL